MLEVVMFLIGAADLYFIFTDPQNEAITYLSCLCIIFLLAWALKRKE